jgi:hypothetical protein
VGGLDGLPGPGWQPSGCLPPAHHAPGQPGHAAVGHANSQKPVIISWRKHATGYPIAMPPPYHTCTLLQPYICTPLMDSSRAGQRVLTEHVERAVGVARHLFAVVPTPHPSSPGTSLLAMRPGPAIP